MFGFSIFEVVMIGVVALVAVGPQRLPRMLKDFGTWMRKLRKMTTDVRAQTGIDDMLRQEGIHGGLNELRSLVRGQSPPPPSIPYRPREDPYATIEVDVAREYPPEGPDSYGALPDDLLAPPPAKTPAAVAASPEPVPASPEPVPAVDAAPATEDKAGSSPEPEAEPTAPSAEAKLSS